jgi:anti-sigma regulatory factor (Ser/Thr protein kinase)
MSTIRLAFSSAPQYVRTARLIGVAVAQRAGVADALLDEVRLAIGEACGRAVARHQRHNLADLVRVEMTDDGPYVVRVIDACDGEAASSLAGAGAEADEADEMAKTLLAGIVDDLTVDGNEVRMVWPVRRRLLGGWKSSS